MVTVGLVLGLLLGFAARVRQDTPIPTAGVLFYTALMGLTALGGAILGGVGGRFSILGAGFAQGVLVVALILSPDGGMF